MPIGNLLSPTSHYLLFQQEDSHQEDQGIGKIGHTSSQQFVQL